jgi:hypothetical protein
MMTLSVLGVLLFGFPVLAVASFTFGLSHTFGSLLTFFALEKLFTATNLITAFYWLWQLFV